MNNSSSFLFVNGTSGNVGIGSANPGRMLDVQGTVRTVGLEVTEGTPTVAGYVLTAADTSGNVTWTPSGGVGDWTLVSNAIYNNNAGNVGINTTNGANVGIGSTAPGATLDVQGTVRSTQMIDTGVTASHLVMTDANHQLTAAAAGTDYAAATSGTNLLFGNGSGGFTNVSNTAAANGNIGIGSATPGQILDVQGTVRTTGFTLSGNGASNGYVMVTNSVGIGTWMAATTLPGTGTTPGGGQAAVQYSNSSAFTGDATKFSFDGANVGIGTAGPLNKLDILGNIGIGTEAYSKYLTTAAPNGGMIVEGNVGIGSTAPGQALDVQGTVRTTGFTLTGNGAAAGFILQSNGSTGIGTWVPEPSGGGSSQWTAINTNDVYLPNSGNVGIGTSKTTTAALTVMNGNVGIGTWVPDHLLTVLGGGIDVRSVADSIYSTLFTSYGATEDSYLRSGNSGTVHIGDAMTSGVLLMENGGGNVGIGTAIPQYNLDVKGSFNANNGTGDFNLNGSAIFGNTSTWEFEASGANTVEFQFGSSQDTIIRPYNTYNIELAPNGGNVGIGSSAPGQLLDVQGTVRTVGLAMTEGTPTIAGYVLTAADTSGNVTWTPSGGVGDWTLVGNTIYNNNAGNVGINTTNGANVGIGSTAPGQALDVQGTVRATGFTLTGNGAAAGYILQSNGSTGIGTWVPEPSGGSGTSPGGGLNAVEYNNPAGTFAGSESKFSFNGTNVGIGTTNGSVLLDVRGTVTASAFQVTSAGNVGIGTSTPQAAFVVTSGNVGIGTWAPFTALNVVGVATVMGDNGIADFENGSRNGLVIGYDTANNWSWLYSRSVGFSSRPLALFTSNANINVPQLYMDLNGNVGLNTTSPANMQGLSVLGGTSIGSYAATAAPNGGLIVSGNVGMGSSNPGQELDVQGTVRTTGFTLTGNGAAAGFILQSNGSTGIGTWVPEPTGGGGSASPGGSSPQLQYDNGGSFGGVSGSGVDSNGNIGLGTTGPLNTLAIVGNVGIGTVSYSKYVTTTAPSGSLLIEKNVGIGTFTPQASLAVMGNVGIGTWVPAAALIVQNGNVGIGTSVATSMVTFSGSLTGAAASISSNTTLDGTYYIVLVDSSSGAVTVTLPTASGIKGRCYRVKDWKGKSGANNITVNTTGGQTIDGASTSVLNMNYAEYDYCSDGANWAQL